MKYRNHPVVWALMLAITLALTACGTAYNGPLSAHFDGKHFSNPGYTKDSSVAG